MAHDLKDNITIAIPAYNEERFLRDAVLSCVDQSSRIVIYDNASEDRTEAICHELAAQHPNITYIRHATNIGALANFKFALDSTQTEYFMWLGAHDLLAENYVEGLVTVLDAQPDAVLAYAPAQLVDAAGYEMRTYRYLYAEQMASRRASERVHAVIRYLDECSLLHGIFRTHMARNCWFDVACLAFDNVFLTKVAVLGRLVRVDSTRYLRRHFRETDSDMEQMYRVSGQRSPTRPSYDEMASQQLEIAAHIDEGGPVMKFFRKERARATLVRRYGPFETGSQVDRVCNLLWYWRYRFFAKTSAALRQSFARLTGRRA